MSCIYGLVDPKNNKVFYVGQTRNNPMFRLQQHIWECNNNNRNEYKIFQIRKILNNNQFPKIIILEWVYDINILNEKENYWLKKYRLLNNKLTNLTNITGNVPKDIITKGSKVHFSKLNEKDVLEIIDLYKHTGISVREIAKLYNVTSGAIGAITRGKNWKHLTGGRLKSDCVLDKLSRPKGSESIRTNLTEKDIKEIRKLYSYVPIKKLAKKYNLTISGIYHIINRRSWKHI